jgi:hypothetical protein
VKNITAEVRQGIAQVEVMQFTAISKAVQEALATPTPVPGATPASTPVTEMVAQEVVAQVAAAVNETVSDTEGSVDTLADALERLWAQYSRALANNKGDEQLACAEVLKAANVTINSTFEERAAFDPYFGRVVDLQHSTVIACNRSSEAIASELCFTQALDAVFRDNLRANPALTWQMYVSQESGAVRIFPGVSEADALEIVPSVQERCDPRRSPTYAAPAFGPRRLLFLVDLYSDALCQPGGGLDRAKLALHALLDSTSEEDFVAVLMPRLPATTACFAEGFVRATPGNLRVLKQVVTDIEPLCGPKVANTTYVEALHRAFDELEGTVRGTSTAAKVTSCQAALVFVTADAGAAATELNTVFNERNDAKIGARLFMYTVGRDLNAVQASSPACTVIGGDVGKVDNERDIIDQLQGFFRLGAAAIKTTAERVVRWSAPREERGAGTLVTAATPVYERATPDAAAVSGAAPARLLGVVTTDISVEVMAAKLLVVPNSKYGRSYAFLIDQHGRVLAHPSLRSAGDGGWSSSAAPDVSSLEVPLAGLGFEAVRQAMAISASGVLAVRDVPLPGGATEVRTYFWKPSGGPFTVVYSLAAEDAEQFLQAEPLAVALTSYYYRLDLYAAAGLVLPPSVMTSVNGSEVSSRNASVVLLAPRALATPADALEDETSAFVGIVHKYLNDALFPNEQAALDEQPPVRAGVRGDVKRTSSLELVWRQSLSQPDAPLRFMFATPRGVLRVMPGESAPFGARSRRVDPLAETWYTEALRSGGALAVTQPRLDTKRGQLIMTISHAVYDERDPSVVLGVSAMDVPQRRFVDVIDRVSQCSRAAGRQCYLLDEEARFVTAVDGDERTIGRSFVPRQPSVALALVRRGFLKRALVPDFASAVVCERWVLSIGGDNATASGTVEEKVSGGCPNGDVWVSEVQRDALPQLAGDAMPMPIVNATVEFDVVDAKLTAPRLYLVIVDAYQFGVGGDCSTLPDELRVDSDETQCEPYVIDQCMSRDFAEVHRPVEVECTDFGGLSRAVVDELRRSEGTPKLEEVCAVVERDVPQGDINLALVIALPIVACILCVGAIAALVVLRARRNASAPPPQVNVAVEKRDGAADAAEEPSTASQSEGDANDDALKAWAPPE